MSIFKEAYLFARNIYDLKQGPIFNEFGDFKAYTSRYPEGLVQIETIEDINPDTKATVFLNRMILFDDLNKTAEICSYEEPIGCDQIKDISDSQELCDSFAVIRIIRNSARITALNRIISIITQINLDQNITYIDDYERSYNVQNENDYAMLLELRKELIKDHAYPLLTPETR